MELGSRLIGMIFADRRATTNANLYYRSWLSIIDDNLFVETLGRKRDFLNKVDIFILRNE